MADEGAIFRQEGDTYQEVLDHAVTAGDIEIRADKVLIAKDDGAIGDTFEWSTNGVFSNIPSLVTDVFAVGTKLFWNDSNKELQLAASDAFFGYSRVAKDGSTAIAEAQLVNNTVTA